MHLLRINVFTAVEVKLKFNMSSQLGNVVCIIVGLAKTTTYLVSELIHSVVQCKKLIFSWVCNLFLNELTITLKCFY